MHPLLAALLQHWRTETPYAGNEDFISPSIEVESPQPRNLHPLLRPGLQWISISVWRDLQELYPSSFGATVGLGVNDVGVYGSGHLMRPPIRW